MKVIIALLLFISSFPNVFFAQNSFGIYSKEVEDSFVIIVHKGEIDTVKPIRYFYYLDAGIKSGHEIQLQIEGLPKLLLQNKVFVGVAHVGDFHQKRRRDFIPPEGGGTDGHADHFYSFLTQKLVPSIESSYGKAASIALVGHSFGGLFVFYSMFREDRTFNKFFALSPSLWVNNYSIFNQESSYYTKSTQLPVFLYLSCGTGEKLNYILAGSRRMKDQLRMRQYESLQFAYEEHQRKTHNNQVPKSVAFLLNLPN